MPDDLEQALTEPSRRTFEITISDQQQTIAADQDWLCGIAKSVLGDEGVSSAEISIAVVDDPTIHGVNRQFLGHDAPTDVISFLLNDTNPHILPADDTQMAAEPGHIDGEIVMSGETALRCAQDAGTVPAHELALYLVHGLLHLCGYDDQSDADRLQMRDREQSHLQKFGIRPHYDD